MFKDGDIVEAGTVVARINGCTRAILSGERTALNFLQRMSGIATLTNKFVKMSDVPVYDTRKTTPGLRILDKYAVRIGGGKNHRFGLDDLVLIKDNHIQIAGGVMNAVKLVRKHTDIDIEVEVEVGNLDEVREAVKAGVDIIMLDNMDVDMMKESVELINGESRVEASGRMDIKRIKAVSKSGVDYISVGALTHSAKALDISLDID